MRRRIATDRYRSALRRAPIIRSQCHGERPSAGSSAHRSQRDCDVLICGASFAGLAVARELAGSGADVVLIDRYEIGERQTSACGIPTGWLEALDLQGSLRQTFGELVIHTPHTTVRYGLPWTFSTFDYRTLCELLAEQGTFEFETRQGRRPHSATGSRPHRPRRHPRRLIVDALGWRRVLGDGDNDPAARRPAVARPRGPPARLRRRAGDLDRPLVRPRRLRLELSGGRRGAGRRRLVRPALPRQASRPCGSPPTCAAEAVRYQGNWIPHALGTRPRTACSSSATPPATACR